MTLDNSIKLKRKIMHYFLKNGKKQNCESTQLKVLKSIQKSTKQSHIEVIKLSILNMTPIFRVIKLKEKKRKKKKGISNVKEIPAFLSNKTFRASWALKLLITTTKNDTKFSNQLKNEILLSSHSNTNTKSLKNELQKRALKKKNLFRRYRW